MNNNKKSLISYLLLWSTQSLSALGSGMTAYALVLWLYLKTGSALRTAHLSVCSYAPYVIMSIFAGALSDKWNKKRTMLVCDLIAALSTVAVLILLKTDTLRAWHLYLLNALNGLMNTVQQPASEVAATLLGSVFATLSPKPKDRVKTTCLALFISMSTENFLLAFGRTPLPWCIGAVLSWLPIPVMNANMDVIFRSEIPLEMQGRVYSCRNTLQFFTIPVGFLMGGILVDKVFEPLMAGQSEQGFLVALFGKKRLGSGNAVFRHRGYRSRYLCDFQLYTEKIQVA